MGVNFLQISDVHLGASMSGLELPPEKLSERRREIKTVFQAAMDLAKARHCDLVLIPGDLFDGEPSEELILFVIESLEKIAPLPVYIIPGNHDPCGPGSPYDDRARATRQQRPWPENVFIFRAPDFQTALLPGRPEVTVTGKTFSYGTADNSRALEPPPSPPSGKFNFLLLHATRDNDSIYDSENVPRFADEELLALNFNYTALGHFHRYGEISDSKKMIRAAYSGTSAGQGLDETGEKFVLLGKLDETGACLEKNRLDHRKIVRPEVLAEGDSPESLEAKILHLLKADNVSENDLLYLSISGMLASGVSIPDFNEAPFLSKFYHCQIEMSELRPGYDLERYKRLETPNSVEERFASRLLRELAQESDPERQRIIRNAIYYGLDALRLGKIPARYDL